MKNFRFVVMLIGLVLELMLLSGCDFFFPRIELLESNSVDANDSHQFTKVTCIAGMPGGPGNLDGIGTNTSFFSPTNITIDENYIYVTDTLNSTIRRINKETLEVITIVGKSGYSGSSDGIGTQALLSQLEGITNDKLFLYVTDSHNSTIRKINKKTLEVTTIAGKPGETGSTDGFGEEARFNCPMGITSDESFLYVADLWNDIIRQINKETFEVLTIPIDPGICPDNITNDHSFLYINNSNSILKINKETWEVETFAGLGGRGNGTITTDDSYLYVTEPISQIIKQINKETLDVKIIAGKADEKGHIDGNGTNARFGYPQGIINDGLFLYVTDTTNNTIRQINKNTLDVKTIAGSIKNIGSLDGFGINTRFYSPQGIINDDSFLFVCDTYNSTIRQINKKTFEVRTIAGNAENKGSADGSGNNASFIYPKGITTYGSFLYITDTANSTIRQVNKETFEVITIAGKAGEDGSIDGIGTNARFDYPEGITSDKFYLYVADSFNHIIRQINKETLEVITIAGKAGEKGSIDGIRDNARFLRPCGITNDESHLYVTDTYNSTIRQINKKTFEVITIAGKAKNEGSLDGFGTNACFDLPEGITNNESFLYVIEYGNKTIRRIKKGTWRVDTIAGEARSFGNRDGMPQSARFCFPIGITIDDGTLYIADSSNNAIKMME